VREGKGESWFLALRGMVSRGFKFEKNECSIFKSSLAGSGGEYLSGFGS